MTAHDIIAKLQAAWPKMLTDHQWWLAKGDDRNMRRKLADMACARGGNALTLSEWHEVSKWGINDDQSRVKDHRKDGTFRKGNQAALKEETRVAFAARLPADVVARLRAAVADKRHASQADAVAALVRAHL